jgi:hypothetical protein
MNPATKNKSLVSIIVFLLITNIAMLVFFLLMNNPAQKNTHPQGGGMSGMLEKEVGFSKDQLNTYQSLRKDQMDTIHALFDDLRKSKMDFYNLIYSPQVTDSTLNNAANVIGERQKKLDLEMFNHFKTVRKICAPDQLPKFDSTIQKVFVRMTSRTGKPQHDQHK